jgi:transposase
MNLTKQIIGVDVSKDTLHVCYGTMGADYKRTFSKTKKFNNDKAGYEKLLAWSKSQINKTRAEVIFICEATGVYHENMVYFLNDKDMSVSVILPNKAKAFSRTTDIKSKTDKIDARMLAEFGLEKELKLWKYPNETLKKLKALSRAIKTCKDKQAAVKNQIHALEHSYQPDEMVLSGLREELALHRKNIKKYQYSIKELIKSDPILDQKIKNILPAKGIGLWTIVTVISETDGFALIQSEKQLASYAGMDVVHRESGLHKGQTTISKRGNSHIRAALYMPALSAKKFNKKFKQFYDRIYDKRKIPAVGIIAVARKMLLLIYTLWVKDRVYNPDYGIA